MIAIVLAGERPGGDPLAKALGAPHKALIEVGGRAMLARVVDTLRQTGAISRIVVVSNVAHERQSLQDIEWLNGEATPSLSVAAALQRYGTPLLVTTADHALLAPAHIEALLQADAESCDLLVGLVSRQTIQQRFPHVQRTYLRFRDDGYSGANLFWLRSEASAKAVAFWRRVEANRKKPWQIAREFGPSLLLGYLLRRFSMAQGVARAGQVMGVKAKGVALPFAEAAIDVDKLADFELANAICAGEA